MKSKYRKLTLLSLSSVVFLTACGQDKMINAKVEQAKMAGDHISSFAAACNGKLSVSTELTGDIENPFKTKISCDDMDKESEFFRPLTDKELKELVEQIKRVNSLD